MYPKIVDSCVFLNSFKVMKTKIYKVIGVMSGTSLDGVDCAYVSITINESSISGLKDAVPDIKATILKAQTIPYTDKWRDKLAAAYKQTREEITILNNEYTEYLGGVITNFITSHHIKDIDAICSHGHTILHQPDDGFTLQIGNLPSLAKIIGHKVVCDFRVQDVALGGQGAPLVPIGDALLYAKYGYCLNLGGFANVSYAKQNRRLAYDICPVNVVLNKYAKQLGRAYDDNGTFAKAGNINSHLLEQLNSLPFYTTKPPKSLGIEWVEYYVFPLLERSKLSSLDILATFTEHIAMQLANQFDIGSSVLVTGGGTFNGYLLERVQKHKKVTLIVPENKLIEFKEALIFALLGVLRLENKINTLSSVTGASYDHCSGIIYESIF